ncbi:oxygen-independent coproporphyrinogen-3 oxidase [Sphingomonas gellani]|uniref:Coproporphyrinogen-III oxidase n=1 Tax=Sphingomonas gellani TaxID=1166340 RepID=A0A1H7YWU8_9SPHN|nr:oxygen-independent coproporphyrinogen III oxidase [Sphingomonas gellani]SEM50443.1 oxygen-independent coproporphyrinogen-3 oxidase [Sphingomonas gellani]
MWTYHPDLLARPVPRYTSYPTAAEFGDSVGPADLEAQLAAIPVKQAVSLYLHVPYCHEICWYCGCNTGAANRRGRLAAYVQRLSGEIDLLSRRLGRRVPISRIAWGGGSPNALDPDDFLALSAQLHEAFDTRTSVTSVEVDPRAFTAEWADAMRQAGVSRASLGVQSFSPDLQARIGRVQPEEMIARTVERLRAAGTRSINFDLMYGLPGQVDADLIDSIERTLALAPERVAVFGYAHVPNLIARQRRIDATALPDAATRFRHAELAHRLFGSAGYQPVGFDHFAVSDDDLAIAAKAGTLRRNFQGFTEDQADVLIGLGASSISSFPGALLQNEKNAGRYQMRIGAGAFATARGLMRSPVDRLRGLAIERLLCSGQADLAGIPDLAGVRDQMLRFEERGLLRWDGDRVVLDAAALPYARTIAAVLDPHRAQPAKTFSSAV